MLLNAEEGIQSFPFLNFTSLPNYEGVFEAGKSDLFKDLLVALINYVTLRPWGVYVAAKGDFTSRLFPDKTLNEVLILMSIFGFFFANDY